MSPEAFGAVAAERGGRTVDFAPARASRAGADFPCGPPDATATRPGPAGKSAEPVRWRRWHQESGDIDEQAGLLPSWEQVYLQLERGRFASAIDGVAVSDEMCLFRKSTDRRLHKVFAASPGTCAVALLTPQSGPILFQDQGARSGDVLILPPGHAFDVVTLGRFDVSVATLDLRCLPPGLDAGLALAPAILSASAVTRRLADAMHRILSPEEVAPAETARVQRHLQARLECHVVDCLIERGFSSRAKPKRRQVELIDAARRMLLSETLMQGQVLPVPQWAARLGFSARQLHKLFQERLGISPRAYAERLRLSRARADLREARPGATTVAAVATKWGFGHLGRFASSYRDAFGELPSDTARAGSP